MNGLFEFLACLFAPITQAERDNFERDYVLPAQADKYEPEPDDFGLTMWLYHPDNGDHY